MSTTTDRPVISGPASGHMLQPFALRSTEGQEVRLREYRQRRNLVLFFHHGGACAACRGALQELAGHVREYQGENAIVLAIGPEAEDQQEVALPFPTLIDREARTAMRHGLAVPALVIADQYGEIWAAWVGGDGHALPDGAEVLQWLEYIQAQCMSCGTGVE